MSRLHPPAQNMAALGARARVVPIASTMAGSLLALLPIIANAPALPPFGLLMLLGWKLLRPELWPVWIGLPLGLFDDLVSGNPLGLGLCLWTCCLLVLEIIASRLIWRDFWQEWLIAGVAIAAVLGGGWLADWWLGAPARVTLLVPQFVTALLCFPLVGRLCAVLDRWRLAR